MSEAASKRGGGSTAKAFATQIYTALQSSNRSTSIISGVECFRFWVQGVVIATSDDQKRCTIDDGTAILQLELKIFLKNAPPGIDARPQLGDYIMTIGPMRKVKADADTSVRTLLAHQVVKLDTKLQREPMWYLEVIEYWLCILFAGSRGFGAFDVGFVSAGMDRTIEQAKLKGTTTTSKFIESGLEAASAELCGKS